MKRYSYSKLKKLVIASLIIGEIMAIAAIVTIYVGGEYSGAGSALMLLIALIVGAVAFPIEVLGFIFNWGKILKGIILPIPVLSSLIESLKSIVYAIKAIIAFFKKQDFILGKEESEADE